MRYRVHKFGGTSVATGERIAAVADLVMADSRSEPSRRLVVVTSALGGVTDQLLQAIREAEQRSGARADSLQPLRQRHEDALGMVAPPHEVEPIIREIGDVLNEVDELLHGIFLLRQCTRRFSDAVVSAGERMAAPVVAAALRARGLAAQPLDARDLVLTDDAFGEAGVHQERTAEAIREAISGLPDDAIPVVTGFIGATADGVTTTLGRSGSDYTATIIGGALDAETVVIWTDVDGVLSADPRLVPDAFTLPRLTYPEAAELAHFGAKVLHPRTMRPLERAGIPLLIKNTLRPDAPGTRISGEVDASSPPIKAVTAVRNVAVVTLEGTGLIDVPDLTSRTFGALARRGMPVMLITQASSEGSLSFAVRGEDGPAAAELLGAAFERECQRGDLRGIRLDQERAIIAAVGHQMHRRPGLAGRMFATLARAHVNVDAIAEGASDHNLACAVLDSDAARAVDALHEAFALRRLRAHLVVLGVGTIGARLLALLSRQDEAMRGLGLNLRLAGVAGSNRLLWSNNGLPPKTARDELRTHGVPVDDPAREVLRRIKETRLERFIVVDATPSPDTPKVYGEWLSAGASVVTPNQRGFVDADDARQTQAAAREGEVPLIYDTTVGGGLSVLPTLRDLVRTGDRVREVAGVFSGTLASVFESMRRGRRFSEAVRDASDRGLTETDPRSDLAGEDVARKLLILAAEMGSPLRRDDVRVESLVPPDLATVSLDTFWSHLHEADEPWQRRLAELGEGGDYLQYVASVGHGSAVAGVKRLPPDSLMARLTGGTVLYAFHTERYSPEPLVVRGPGASADITAAVLLADIVRAAEAMR